MVRASESVNIETKHTKHGMNNEMARDNTRLCVCVLGLADPSQYYESIGPLCATPTMSLREQAWHHPVPETAQDSLDYYMGWPSWLSASVVTVVCAYWHHVMTVFPYVRFSAQLGLNFAMTPNLHAPWVVPREKRLWVAPCRRKQNSNNLARRKVRSAKEQGMREQTRRCTLKRQ